MDDSIDDLVVEFGRVRNRPAEQIASVCQLLSSNWISTLRQWHELDAASKRSVRLPLALEEHLSRLAETCAAELPPATPSSELPSSELPTALDVDARRVEDARLINERLSNPSAGDVRFCYFHVDDDGGEYFTLRFDGRRRHRAAASAPFSDVAQLVAESLGCARGDVRLYSIVDPTENSLTLHQMDSVVRPFSCSIEASIFPPVLPTLPVAAEHLWRVDEAGALSRTVRLGRAIVAGAGHPVYLINKYDRITGIDGWLASLGLERLLFNFYTHEVHDFFAVPWLTRDHLEQLAPGDAAAQDAMFAAVERLRDGSSADFVRQWVDCLGFGASAAALYREAIDLEVLSLISSPRLAQIGVPADELPLVFFFIRQYRDTSSVELSYNWLESHGFHYVQVSLEFVRSNLPFYSLPWLVRFLFYEMGVSGFPRKFSQLVPSIDSIEQTLPYQTMAMFSLLRDLSLEQFALQFAKRCSGPFMPAFQSLTKKTMTELLAGAPRDVVKNAVANVIDAKTLWIYYLSIDVILREPVIQKNTSLFIEAGVPADHIPFLESMMLFDMGVSLEDRLHINRFLRAFDDRLAEIVFMIYGDEPERAPHAFQKFSKFRSKISQLASQRKSQIVAAAAATTAATTTTDKSTPKTGKPKGKGQHNKTSASSPPSTLSSPPSSSSSSASSSSSTSSPPPAAPVKELSSSPAKADVAAAVSSPATELLSSPAARPSSLDASRYLLAALSAGPLAAVTSGASLDMSPTRGTFGNWAHVDYTRFLPDRAE